MKRKLLDGERAYFLGLTFGIPLVCCLLMMAIQQFETGVWQLVLYAIQGASPALAVVILMFKQGKFKAYMTEKYIVHFKWKYCIVGLLVPALVLTAAKMISNAVLGDSTWITLVSIKKLMIILWALVAEELGWRGYLQEKLEPKVGVYATPLIVGIIWTLWHYHFFLTGSMEVPLIAFAYGCIVESYGYYVITKIAKGNVIPASIWHFSGNLFFDLYLLDPVWNQGSMVPYMMTNGLYSVYLIAFFIFLKKLK